MNKYRWYVIMTGVIFAGAACLYPLKITEVMHNPNGGSNDIPGDDSNEYIELYNDSGHTVDLSGYYFIHYNKNGPSGTSRKIKTLPEEGVTLPAGSARLVTDSYQLPAGGYALIIDQEYTDPQNNQPYSIAEGTVVLTVHVTSLSGFGGLSGTSHTKIELYGPDRLKAVFTYGYRREESMRPHHPLELIDLTGDDRPGAYADSLHHGGTPGAANSDFSTGGTLRITEVMYDPAGKADAFPGDACNEFIELYNEGAKPVNLANYRIGTVDGNGQADRPSDILPWRTDLYGEWSGTASPRVGTTILPAGGFAVIMDRDYLHADNTRPYSLPPDAVVLTTDDDELGDNAALTANDTQLVLHDCLGNIVTVMDMRSADEAEGYSRELKMSGLADAPDAYGPSTVPGGTPGAANTYWAIYTRGRSDRFIMVRHDGMANFYAGYPHTVRFYATGNGRQADYGFNRRVRVRFPGKERFTGISSRHGKKIKGAENIRFINGISEIIKMQFTQAAAGRFTLSSSHYSPHVTVTFRGPDSRLSGKLIINEIMADSADDDDDWLELYNRSSSRISLRGVHLDNFSAGSLNRYTDLLDGISVPAKQYVVLCRSRIRMVRRYGSKYRSSFIEMPALRTYATSQDIVFLRDGKNRVVDGVHYRASWGVERDRSLERIRGGEPGNRANNWNTCMSSNGATPGYENSIHVRCHDTATIRVSLKRKVFSRRRRNKLPIRIHSSFPLKVSGRIRSVSFRTDFTLFENKPVGKNDSFVCRFNGKNDRGERLPLGIYHIHVEGTNRFFGKKVFARNVIIVGR